MLEETRQNDPEAYEQIIKEVERRKQKFERGGKREGAGRKRVKTSCLSHTMRVDNEEKALIELARKNKISIPDLIKKIS
jgi:Trm5-related predicted tRNA methylase